MTAVPGWRAWYATFPLVQTADKQQHFRLMPQAQPVAGPPSVEPVILAHTAMYVRHSRHLPRMTMQQPP